jgi:hypothetical protein
VATHSSQTSRPEGQHWTLEFIGGPLDGYTYTASFPLSELVDTMAMPVNQNVVRMLGGAPKGEKAPATSVALYELVRRGGAWRYDYLGAASAEQFQLESWIG